MSDEEPVPIKVEVELGCSTLAALLGALLLAAVAVGQAINHAVEVLAK